MNRAEDSVPSAEAQSGDSTELEYEKPEKEQELRADLEELWQDESPATARETDFADEVDGRLGTRHRGSETP